MRRVNKKCTKLIVISGTMQFIALVLGWTLAVVGGVAVNYCGSRMCGNTDAHTFCQFPEGPSPECVGYISAHLTVDEKSRVIARLNRRRNEAAAGNMRGMPSAGNMLKLRWVEELAREAQRWADQCRPPQPYEEHDACRDLYSISVGQCVASVVGEAPGLRVESMVDIWYMQSMLYKGNVTFYMPSNNGTFYGDFAQIMWAKSYMVGCGRSRFMTPWQGRLRSVERLVCNIAPMGPPPNRPLWAPAAPAASCPPRAQRDVAMTALCDYQRDSNEIIRIDASMTLEEHLLLNAVLEIENNTSINYQGSLDELYLTRLAIATMENTVSTQVYYNSMQRRDVVEALELAERTDENRITSTLITEELTSGANTTLQAVTETTTAKNIKTIRKKVSLVGRPKTYNMEELTDFDEKTENNTPIEDIPKKEKDFYAEYVFNQFEMPDDNFSTSVDYTNATTVETTMGNVVFDQDSFKEVLAKFDQNDSIYAPDTSFENNIIIPSIPNNISINISTTVSGNGTASTPDKIDDYLSDPETVRELQEALERIEHEMAPIKNTGKVRRELRDPEEEDPTSKSPEEVIAEVERNRSIDRGPMYNIVLKYMPYLKQYEGGILSPSEDSGASRSYVSPLFMLVVTFCL